MVNKGHLVSQVGDQKNVTKNKLVHLAGQEHQALVDREVSRDHYIDRSLLGLFQ